MESLTTSLLIMPLNSLLNSLNTRLMRSSIISLIQANSSRSIVSPVITLFADLKLPILRSRKAISTVIGILNEILSHSYYYPYLPRNQGLQSSHLRRLSHGAVLSKTDLLGVIPAYLKLQQVQQLYGDNGQVKLGVRDQLLTPPLKDP